MALDLFTSSPAPRSYPWSRFKTSREYLLALLEHGQCSQRGAARALEVDERSFRRWVSEGDDSRQPPWAAVELLRRMIVAGELGGEGDGQPG